MKISNGKLKNVSLILKVENGIGYVSPDKKNAMLISVP
jgi:hypothetical protein